MLAFNSSFKAVKFNTGRFIAFNPDNAVIADIYALIYGNIKGTLTKEQKQFNKEMEMMANAYRDEIELDMHRGKLKFADFKKAKVNFVEYYAILTEKRKRMSSGNYGNCKDDVLN